MIRKTNFNNRLRFTHKAKYHNKDQRKTKAENNSTRATENSPQTGLTQSHQGFPLTVSLHRKELLQNYLFPVGPGKIFLSDF
jgi:hypothetical protein